MGERNSVSPVINQRHATLPTLIILFVCPLRKPLIFWYAIVQSVSPETDNQNGKYEMFVFEPSGILSIYSKKNPPTLSSNSSSSIRGRAVIHLPSEAAVSALASRRPRKTSTLVVLFFESGVESWEKRPKAKPTPAFVGKPMAASLGDGGGLAHTIHGCESVSKIPASYVDYNKLQCFLFSRGGSIPASQSPILRSQVFTCLNIFCPEKKCVVLILSLA